MGRPKLLLAEDNAAMAARFQELLGKHFEVVDVVADGQTLIGRTEELRPDVIVTDVGLAGLDGISATGEIRRRFPTLPIIIMTVDADPELKVAALAAGGSAFLLKPEAAGSIVRLLQDMTAERTPTRSP